MNVIEQALKLVYLEANEDSKLKQQRVLKKIKKDAKKYGWTEDLIKTMDPEWRWRIGNALLAMGDLSWKGYQFRDPRGGMIPFEYEWWKGNEVKNLLVMGEQGLGDEIMFASILPELEPYAQNITVECQPRLASVFQRSFPNYEFVGRKDFRDAEWTKGRHFDAQFLLGDLCPLFRQSRKSFRQEPYLIPRQDLVEKWQEWKIRWHETVGISWKGRQGGYRFDQLRYPGAINVNLQYDEEPPENIISPSIDLKNDIEDIFALTYVMDKIIAVPTSLVHIAGSMGKETHVIKPVLGRKHGGFDETQNNALNWRWSKKHNGGKTSIWHPSVKIYENLDAYHKELPKG